MPRKIDISHKTVIFIAIFLFGVWILYQIIDLLLLLFIAVILMSALSPAVTYLTKLKFPKPLAILLIYILILSTVIGILTVSFTPLINETIKLSTTLPETIA